jgi:hypothetical protein
VKKSHKLLLAAAVCLPLSISGVARGATNLPAADEPAGEPHFKQVRKVIYMTSYNGKVSPASTWEGIVIVKTPSGMCIRTERSRLNFVRDGEGFQPEYEEYRRVVPCSTSSVAADIIEAVKQAYRSDAPAPKKP